MGENTEPGVASSPVSAPMKTSHPGHLDSFGNPITQQMRIIGQRRRVAEEKLEQHLQEARAKHPPAGPGPVGPDVPGRTG